MWYRQNAFYLVECLCSKVNQLIGEEQEEGSARFSPPLEAHTRNPKNSQEERRNGGEGKNSCSESSLSGTFINSMKAACCPPHPLPSVPRNCLITGAQGMLQSEWMRVSGPQKLLPLTIPLRTSEAVTALSASPGKAPLLVLSAETHWLKPPTLAKHHSNCLCELF